MSQAALIPAASDGPSLRLVTSSDFAGSGGELSPSMRLTEFFEQVYLPWLRGKGSSAKTIRLYRESLAHWSQITGNPRLYEISDETCDLFVAGLWLLPGRKSETMASHTIKRHVNQIQWVLDRTGPRIANDRKRRRNKGLLEEVPLIEKPTVDVEAPDGDFTFDETLQILDAFSRHKPRSPKPKLTGGVPTEQWWRALIVLLYYTGLRIGTAMRLEWSMVQGEWLVAPPRIKKRRKGKKQFLPQEVRDMIEPLRRGVSPLIFYYPNWIEKDGAQRSMRRTFELRLEKAGLPEHRQFGFHGFRKAHATELALTNPLAAQLSLGHSSMKTTQDHYVNPRVAAEAVKKMPSIKAAERLRNSKQLQLF